MFDDTNQKMIAVVDEYFKPPSRAYTISIIFLEFVNLIGLLIILL